jgi:AcrR family transcriptional regulator
MTVTPGETPRRRLPAAERRALIVEAAFEEFSAHGYEGASLGTIAERAGITRTVLYGHFPSKRALFDALLAAKHDELLGALRTALNDNRKTDVRMRAAFEAMLNFADREPAAWRLLYPDRAPADPEVAADHARIQGAANRILAQSLAPDAKRAGIDPGSDLARAMFALQQNAFQGLVRWSLAHPRVPREVIIDAAMKSIWLGVRALEQGEG